MLSFLFKSKTPKADALKARKAQTARNVASNQFYTTTHYTTPFNPKYVQC